MSSRTHGPSSTRGRPSALPDAPRHAVDRLRVLSFGTFVAGNTTALMLAELGADVVKIEARARPEVLRYPAYEFGPNRVTEPSGIPTSIMYSALSRSTRNLALDVHTEDGRALFRRLVSVADVVIENFGVDTMRRWGCAFDQLVVVNPRLVVVSLSGYGRTGPRARYLAYATNISNFSGLITSAWGIQHGTYSDYIASVHAVLGVLAAVLQVNRTGQGVYLDVAQTEALAAVNAPVYLDPLNNGRDTAPAGNSIQGSFFTEVFPSRGHDRWIALELEDLDDWARLCAVLERPDLLVDSLDAAARRRHELAAAVREWSATRTPHTAAQVLQRAGLAAGAVYDNEDAVRDPQLRARGAVVEVAHPDLGTVEYAQSPHRLAKTPGRVRRPAARLGQHTLEVLREWLGLDDRELETLATAGALWQAPDRAPEPAQAQERGGGAP